MSGGNCEKCTASLQGAPIPQEYLYMYNGLTHYSRMIGIEVRGVYDGILVWQCPDCGFMWPRRTSGPLHDEAVKFIAEQERKMNEAEQERLRNGNWTPKVPF